MIKQLAGRVPVIVESNFSRRSDEIRLAPHLAHFSPVLLHCETDTATIQRRIVNRNGSTDRHPGHFDDLAWLDVEQRGKEGLYDPLDLPYPTLRIDTTAGLNPGLAAILEYLWTEGTGIAIGAV